MMTRDCGSVLEKLFQLCLFVLLLLCGSEIRLVKSDSDSVGKFCAGRKETNKYGTTIKYEDPDDASMWIECRGGFAHGYMCVGDGMVFNFNQQRCIKLIENYYEISVYTGKISNAGTNAFVYITIYGIGIHSHTQEIQLHDEQNGNEFEKGKIDRFTIQTKSLGTIYRIRIRHDNSGLLPGWFLDKVDIIDRKSKRVYHFCCYRWLATDKEDQTIETVIKSGVPSKVRNLKANQSGHNIVLHWDKPICPEQGTLHFTYLINCTEETSEVNETKNTNLTFAVPTGKPVIHCQMSAKNAAGLGPSSMIIIDVKPWIDPQHESSKGPTTEIAAYSFFAIFGLLIIIVLVWKRRKTPTETEDEEFEDIPLTEANQVLYAYREEKRKEPQENFNDDSNLPLGKINHGSRPDGEDSDAYEYNFHKLKYLEVLGQGAFSNVIKATAENIAGKKGASLVAVKVLKKDADQQGEQHFQNELEILKKIGLHPYLVKLIGCCSLEDAKCIILEYLPNGNLLSFLRHSHGNVPERQQQNIDQFHLNQNTLLNFAVDITKGMVFLATKNIVHRDLACRNVLVDSQLNCKICDFGLARILDKTGLYKKSQEEILSAKWLSPESLLKGIFTFQSDIWSFGIVLYEIVTIGLSPYPGHKPEDIKSLLEHGYRMIRPTHCGKEIYNIMLMCWKEKPWKRSSFKMLTNELEGLLQEEKNTYINLDAYQDRHYINLEDENVC